MTGFINNTHDYLVDPDRIPVAIAALLLTLILGMITGPFAGNANPFLWFLTDRVLGGIGDRLDNTDRSRRDLIARGMLMLLLSITFSILVVIFYQWVTSFYSSYFLIDVVSLSLLITSGAVWFSVLRLYTALDRQDELEEGAYLAIARSMRRNLNASDDFGITRTGMSLAARSFDKGLVAPITWYLIGGIPVAVLYTVFAALSWRFGKDGFSKGLGVVPLAMERLLGMIPSLCAAGLMTVAALFTPTAKMHRGAKVWLGMKNHAPYEQGGAPLSVMAWALNISLGGAGRDLSGHTIQSDWIGPAEATAQINHKHLRRGLYLSIMAHILFLATLCGAYVWAG